MNGTVSDFKCVKVFKLLNELKKKTRNLPWEKRLSNSRVSNGNIQVSLDRKDVRIRDPHP